MAKEVGFTLAEVLITLGVIGVVAALTVPSLVANTNSAKFKAQFKKDISTLSQAARMAQAQYDVDFSGLTWQRNDGVWGSQTTDRLSEGQYTLPGLLNNTLAGVTVSEYPPSSAPYPISLYGSTMYAQLADGSILVFNKYFGECTASRWNKNYIEGNGCYALIDVNGVAGPNKIVGTGSESPYGSWTPREIPTQSLYVPNTADKMTDVYPVLLHDGIVEPATEYAKYVLTAK